jgi:hypothetical protein
MSGSKIRSAVENLKVIFEDHINQSDYILIITFCEQIQIEVPITKKEGKETFILSKVSSLTRPHGGTGLNLISRYYIRYIYFCRF